LGCDLYHDTVAGRLVTGDLCGGLGDDLDIWCLPSHRIAIGVKHARPPLSGSSIFGVCVWSLHLTHRMSSNGDSIMLS
jgi:hypothetical protein